MTTSHTMRSRLKFNRPSVRKHARPPRLRTHLGAAFTAANLPAALVLQVCPHCQTVQYPPRELCGRCLEDGLVWREIGTGGRLLNGVDLHHSLWEYFKRRIASSPWPVATVRLDCDVTVFAHLALTTFDADSAGAIPGNTRVQVFSHTDASRNAVLIAVGARTSIASREQRRAIADALGLLEPSERPGGI